MLQPHAPYYTRWRFVRHRYVPLGIIWSPGSYPTVAAGYDDKFATLRKWVLARLAWMEAQLKQVRGQAPVRHMLMHEQPNLLPAELEASGLAFDTIE